MFRNIQRDKKKRASYFSIFRRDAVWQRLAALPRRQRSVLVLRYYEGLTDDEIAEILGARPGTVRSLISRALASLRETARAA